MSTVNLLPIGYNIKRIREEKGWSQVQLAKACGMKDSQLRRYELNHSLPRKEQIQRIGTSREAAKQARDTNEMFGEFLDDEEFEKNKFYSEIYKLEEKNAVDFFYSSIVPILKVLGYRSNLFINGSNWSVILQKEGKEREISFKDMKELILDSNHITNYYITKNSHRLSSQTKECRDALRNSPAKETSVYVSAKPEEGASSRSEDDSFA